MEKKNLQQGLAFLIAACILAFIIIARQQPPQDGWLRERDGVSYIVNGEPVTGWQTIGDGRYYFGTDGILRTGWQTIAEHTYYFMPDGNLVTGWLELGVNRYYLDEEGVRVTGWKTIDGLLHYFGADGALQTGIVEENGALYLLGEEGLVCSDWIQIDGALYYGDAQGHPVSGWTQIGGRTHYFLETGAAASGWLELDGFLHYFYTDGAPAQGEQTVDGQIRHFASNGQLLVLVNPWNQIPEDYTAELVAISDAHQIAQIAYEDYLDMMADCAAAGFRPVVCSAYRTQEYQENLYQNRINRYVWAGYSVEEATNLAGRSVAVPGTSEHQLGLALDIVDARNGRLDESQADMPTQQWLMENSWRYGWILRYPNEKSEITGIIYEPWHYRYVGRTVAKEIYELGICLEEYLELLTNAVG